MFLFYGKSLHYDSRGNTYVNNNVLRLLYNFSFTFAAKVQNAIEYLKINRALDETENLTIVGRYLTMLPMEPKLGKMLILGAILNCLDPMLSVVAALSVLILF
ncbi:D -box ATP-dependent RNA helicase D 5, mitochondrial-like isoform X2 [Olea europaea subsp. europaea]|uniref:RNA helicase n=1 Tax=Olea europaea subsp. europaea TaxID=158383 RepID=A0A8S0QG11_OLEEU|nr:D -box ATP-dependent RNA helicase D 5, mitochondrial-like isoform X2 [Olea europaea subsp. europaea]